MPSAFRLSSEKEDAVWDWVHQALGDVLDDENIIWEKQNEYRPQPPYISLNIVSGPVKLGGQAELRHKTGDKFTVNAMKQVTISVTAYGGNDLNLIERVQDSLGTVTAKALLRVAGLAVVSEEPIVSASAEIEGGFEERASMDVILSYASSIEDEAGIIEHVELEGEVDDHTFTTTIN